jgi:hypothetical protein
MHILHTSVLCRRSTLCDLSLSTGSTGPAVCVTRKPEYTRIRQLHGSTVPVVAGRLRSPLTRIQL